MALPVRKEQEEKDPVFDTSKVSILIVDDLPDKIMAYHSILEELNQNIFIAHSGEEALKLVLRQEFAVILLDVNMPGMDGLETAAMIRQRKKSAHTPIIFLTAFTDELRMAQGYASGAVDYLPTPVVPEVLKAKIRVFIELSQMRRQAALQAEERAMRTAAEKSAERSKFLVTASEIIVRSRNQGEIVQALQELTVPFIADASLVWLGDVRMEPISVDWTSKQRDKPTQSRHIPHQAPALQVLEKAIRQAIDNTQPVPLSHEYMSAVTQLGSSVLPLDEQATSAIVLPFAVKGFASGALVLARFGETPFQPDEISLANDLLSRAGIALENIMLVERIQDADRRKNEFLAMLAHELRNPLAPIRNALEVIKMGPDSERRQLAEQTIERQVRHMVHLVDDLMDISRITQGKIDLRKEDVQLSEPLNHAIETAQPLIRQRGHTLTVDIPEAPIWMSADAARISQIFSNLLNNAAKYMDNNGRITLTVEAEEKAAVITVSDNGIGISQEMLPRIFDMFSQIDSSLERAQGGLGIGLTLVKSLIEMHGGTIRAESGGIGKGSRFVVTLPLIQKEMHAGPVTQESEETPQTGQSLRVLVVDDNEASAKTLGWMIEIFGHEVHILHDGPSAIEYAQRTHPHVVLLDIGLPGMNGYEICRRMRENPGVADSVFIAQTGWGQPEHRQRSKEAGFDHHLVKPIDMKTLQGILGGEAAG